MFGSIPDLPPNVLLGLASHPKSIPELIAAVKGKVVGQRLGHSAEPSQVFFGVMSVSLFLFGLGMLDKLDLAGLGKVDASFGR